MLARSNRIVQADDYRSVVRSGRPVVTAHAKIYERRSRAHENVRFGFIVSKAVGNAVHRNLVRRRLKAIAARHLLTLRPGTDLVIRALPGSAEAGWDTLDAEISGALTKGTARE